jgi:hypothetical protein
VELPEERLAPAPTGSRWGRTTVGVYLGLVAVCAAWLGWDLLSGHHASTGSFFLSVLTAPWSGLLAPLAGFVGGFVGPEGVRATGFGLLAACAALNARILYGIAARMQRDAADRG